MPRFNAAAYAPEDVADAERGRPDVDLSGYAAARGLKFVGSGRVAGFLAHTPLFPDYVFNCMRGALPGGEWGLVEHDLDECHVTPSEGVDQGGPYYGLQLSTVGSFRRLFTGRGNKAFDTDAVWVPTTRVVIKLPEAAALPWFDVRREERLGKSGTADLADHGVPGLRLFGDESQEDAALLRDLFGGPAGAVLRDLDWPFVGFALDTGQLALVRNGYVREESELDLQIRAACELAAAVRELARLRSSPQPFEAELPPPEWADPDFRPSGSVVLGETRWDAFRRLAGELGMALEDPHEYHRAFPTVPVPGAASGVVRGVIPGTSRVARMAWHHEGLSARAWIRGALLLPAAPAAPELPPQGEHVEVEGVKMVGEVRDGIASAWVLDRDPKELDPQGLMRRGLELLRRLGPPTPERRSAPGTPRALRR